MKAYAVVTTYSFDEACNIVPVVKLVEAKKYLRKILTDEFRVDSYENGYDSECKISKSGMYGEIINHFGDHDDITEFHIGDLETELGV